MTDSKNENELRGDQMCGAIYAPFINPQIKAVAELNIILEDFIREGIDVLMCYQHNATLVAKQLRATEDLPDKCLTFERPPILIGRDQQGEEVPVLKEHFPDQVILYSDLRDKQFILAVEEFAESHPDRTFTFVLIEIFCTGKTMSALALLIKNALDKYPMVYFKILLLQETIQKEELVIPDQHLIRHAQLQEHVASGRCRIDYRQVPSILGKDVDFQCEYGHPKSHRPFVVFNHVNGKVVSAVLTPSETTTARDLVIALGQGKFRNRLGNLH